MSYRFKRMTSILPTLRPRRLSIPSGGCTRFLFHLQTVLKVGGRYQIGHTKSQPILRLHALRRVFMATVKQLHLD